MADLIADITDGLFPLNKNKKSIEKRQKKLTRDFYSDLNMIIYQSSKKRMIFVGFRHSAVLFCWLDFIKAFIINK